MMKRDIRAKVAASVAFGIAVLTVTTIASAFDPKDSCKDDDDGQLKVLYSSRPAVGAEAGAQS
jgi:hypothetical protein